jgi:molybdopterin-guanine dinucleotide biosynthesis protein A
MSRAGFVLVGGRSSRMGRDKALLPFRGRTLAEHIADQVLIATGQVSLIGNHAIYSYLGFPVIEDQYAGCGPLSGIQAAVTHSAAEWNFVCACDLPDITSEFIDALLQRAEQSATDAVIPVGPAGLPEPLCAAYHQRCGAAITQALSQDVRKVMDGLASLDLDLWHVPDSQYFHNLNTLQDWRSYTNA